MKVTSVDWQKVRQAHGPAILLGFLLFVALLLRLIGIGFDLPYLMHPDEDAVVMPAINILKTGDWAPTRMEYGTFHIYLLTAVFAGVFSLAARDGRMATVDQLPLFERGTIPAIYTYPEYFLAARLVSAVLGMLFVLVVYMLGRRLGNQRQGLIAAAIAAFLPALVVNDHFATTDTALMFWVALSLYLLLRVYDNWERDNFWAYAGAGFVCGLAASTKYNGLVLAVPLLLVPLLRVRGLDECLSWRVIAGPLAMLVGFLAGTPYALLDLPKFLYWFGYSLHLYNAPGREVVMPVWLWHVRFHLTNPHMPVMILGVIGLVLSFRYWGMRRAAIVNSFAVVLWLAILGQTNAQSRMWLPGASLFILWAALVLDILMGRLVVILNARQKNPHWAY
ncbi:MAG TPA: glycosyltransferase family 39 protein, partial [Chloroflexota bacterium]|nr:glycosyltransferase family 39 protein [Chloroflexota bacterium]